MSIHENLTDSHEAYGRPEDGRKQISGEAKISCFIAMTVEIFPARKPGVAKAVVRFEDCGVLKFSGAGQLRHYLQVVLILKSYQC